MMFILDLLNKIKWDPNEDPKDYRIYYYDRVEKTNREFKFNDIKEVLSLYIIIDKDGKKTYTPIHRIREVRKDGVIIWKR